MTVFDPWANATPSQRQVLAYLQERMAANERAFVYWMGGVRSGKSFGACMAVLEHLSSRENETYMVLAYTASQGVSIFGREMMRIAEAMDLEPKLTRGATPRLTFRQNSCEVLFRGADKTGRDRAIQGLTLSGLVADEVPNLHRETLHQAEARVSGSGGLRIYTSNKTSPYHWSTKYYHDRLQDGSLEGLLVDSVVGDNTNVDIAFVEERANEFTGDTLTRFIENEFTLDEPPIYRPCMEMGTVKGKPSYTAIYGHATGYEVLSTVEVRDRLYVTTAASYGAYQDLSEVLTTGVPFLVNNEQPYLARRIRAMGQEVRGYRSEFDPRLMEVVKDACRQELLWISDRIQGLWEAVNCYSRPGVYTWPIVHALEALAYPLRSNVS